MTIKVTQSSNSYSIKVKNYNNLKVSVSAEAGSVAGNLSDLEDFDPTGVQNGYVIIYDSTTQKYIPANPDEILSNAVEGGLPTDFVGQLDNDLDNKIDLDAGTF
jgi:hypothetical protein